MSRSRPRWWRIRDWRVRSKLAAAMLIPTVATIALVGAGIATSVAEAGRYSQAESVAGLARQTTALIHELQRERDRTAGYLASGRRRGEPDVTATRQRVDHAIKGFHAAAQAFRDSDPQLVDRLTRQLDSLGTVRAAVTDQSLTRSSVLAQYTTVIAAFIDVISEISRPADNHQLDDAAETVETLSLAKEYASQVRAQLISVLESGTGPDSGSFMVGQFAEYAGAITREQSTIDRFHAVASDTARTTYAEYVRGPAVSAAKVTQDSAVRQQHSTPIRLDANDWFQNQTVKVGAMREVELRLLEGVLGLTGELRTQAYEEAAASGLLLFGILAITAAAVMVLARAMTRPLRGLRSAALTIAGEQLPAVIERLRHPDVTDLSDVRATPVGIDSRDEIGEVARAFDAVNREAVRLAADQAAMRANVNAMFVNLSRRSQGLVERQLRLIDELESREHDSEQLDQLFKLDHLATRMRRNHDSLAVLAGARAGRQDSRATALPDVALAAMSEVEQYSRITRGPFPELSLVGYAVNDVVHLLAELLENATAFSPPSAIVTVSSIQVPRSGEVIIHIEDEGIGMGPEDLHKANTRLAAPPVIDAAAVRTMGLFVVGRLASKHDIRVEFLPRRTTGLTARVVLPARLLTNNALAATRTPPAAMLRPSPRHQAALPATPGNHHSDIPADPAVHDDPGTECPLADDSVRRLRGRTEPEPVATHHEDNGTECPLADDSVRRIRGRADGAGESAGVVAGGHGAPPPPAQQPTYASPWFGRAAPPHAADATPALPRIAPTDSSLYARLSAAWERQPAHHDNGASAATPPHVPSPPGPETGGHPVIPPPLPPQRTGDSRPPAPGSARPAGSRPSPAARPPQPSAPAAGAGWETKADEGWRAAAAASQPTYQQVTSAGLPVRAPMANLVPGSVVSLRGDGAAAGQAGESPPGAGAAQRSPEGIRSLLSTYYASYRRGRVDDSPADAFAGEPSGPPYPATPPPMTPPPMENR